jgi:peptidoglycan/xylan/chitin deacetylase (PgdA/CDA1 family)
MRSLQAAGFACRYFAYPYGASNAEVRQLVREAGYEGAFSIRTGVITRDADPYALPRIEVLRGDTTLRLRWKLWTAQFVRQPAMAS